MLRTLFRHCLGEFCSAEHADTLVHPRAWNCKSCSECVYIAQVQYCAMLLPLFGTKLSSFWIALSAGGADAQCFAFVHVENSHSETLRNALPREANISPLYTSPHLPCEFSFLCCSWPFSDSKLLLQAQDLESALTVTEKLFCMAESIFFAWSILLSCFSLFPLLMFLFFIFFLSSLFF